MFGCASLRAQWVWQPQFHTENRLRDLRLLPDGRGIAIGDGNVLLCTMNGGEVWTGTGSADPDLMAASLAGSTFYFANFQGGVFSTNNPELCLSDLLAIASPALSNLTDLHMVSSSKGYAVANGFVRFSNNTWTSSTAVANLNCPTDAQAIWFVTEDLGFAATNSGKVIRIRQDAGTFLCDQVASNSQSLHNIHFADDQHGYAVGTAGTVFYTEDSGQTWQNRTLPEEDDLLAVFATTPLTVHAAGNQLYRSTDGGLTWERQSKPSQMTQADALWFISAESGWVAGANGFLGFTGNAGGTGVPLHVQQQSEPSSLWSFSPNPASRSVMLTVSTQRPTSWNLWNSQGTRLKQGTLTGTVSVSVEDLPAGLYWLSVGTGTAKSLVVEGSDGGSR